MHFLGVFCSRVFNQFHVKLMKSLSISPFSVVHISESLVRGDYAGSVRVLANEPVQLALGNGAPFEAGIYNPLAKQ